MNTRPTPETDEALSTAECEEDLVVKMRRMESERDEARAEMIRWQSIAEGRGRTDDDTSVCQELNDANERMGKKLAQTLDERDRLAEVMAQILNTTMNHTRRELLLEQALQSLTPKP